MSAATVHPHDVTGMFGEFEGRPVNSTAVELPSLAGGLRDASEVEGGRVIKAGDEAYILIKVTGAKTRFQAEKDDEEAFMRVDIPKVDGLMFVEGEDFRAAIAAHQAKVIEMKAQQKEAREGIKRLKFEDDGSDDEQAAEDGVGPGDVPKPLASVPDLSDDDADDGEASDTGAADEPTSED